MQPQLRPAENNTPSRLFPLDSAFPSLSLGLLVVPFASPRLRARGLNVVAFHVEGHCIELMRFASERRHATYTPRRGGGRGLIVTRANVD